MHPPDVKRAYGYQNGEQEITTTYTQRSPHKVESREGRDYAVIIPASKVEKLFPIDSQLKNGEQEILRFKLFFREKVSVHYY